MAELEGRDLTVEFDSGGYRVRPLDRLTAPVPMAAERATWWFGTSAV